MKITVLPYFKDANQRVLAFSACGRANRAGRAVLYCAESEMTAVAGVQPARGYWVSTCQLRTSLSTPLARSDDIADYLPSQKLCEYAEKLHYDGVRYPSAMEDEGVNVVLFDPTVAEIFDSNLVEVTSMKVGYHSRWFPPKGIP
jgi:RES domain-containing protein